MTKKPELTISRRSVLAGLGTLGVASAGAGLGTTAFFSDREEFNDNEFVSGELDLKVDWVQEYYGPAEEWTPVNSYPEGGVVSSRNEIASERFGDSFDNLSAENQSLVESEFRNQFADAPDDFEGPLVELDDVKPGDKGRVCFSLHLFDNPGYIWLNAKNFTNAENGVNEPELKDPDEDDPGDGSSEGELGDAVMTRVYYDDDGDCAFGEGDALIFGPGDGVHTEFGGENPATLSEAMETMSRNGGFVPLDGESPYMGYGAGATDGARDCFVNSTTKYVVFEWWLPVDHANEIQSDSASFDLGFYAQQCRHSDGSLQIDGDCAACELDAGSFTESSLVDIQSVDASAFPDVSVFARVDTDAGAAGELVDDFTLCENGFAQDESASFTTGSAADIVFVLDDTGSMGDEISEMKANIKSFADDVDAEGIDARYALVTFKDLVEIDQDFTSDSDVLDSAVDAVTDSGGFDFREDDFDALAVATRNQSDDSGGMLSSFRSGAQRVIVDITDAAAHTESSDSSISDLNMSEVETMLDGYTYIAVSEAGLDSSYDDGNKEILANNVGGTWIDIDSADFGVILNDIKDILTTTYTINYTTCKDETDGTTRDVLLVADDPVEGQLAAKPSYTAPS